MARADLIVRGRQVYTPAGPIPACIVIHGGAIDSVQPYEGFSASCPIYDAGDLPVLPGLVDTHVHINEPGRTEWEGFATATRAAAAGGITTLVDMPLNSLPPTVDVDSLSIKRKAAAGQVHVDVGFWGGAVPGHISDLSEMFAAGVFGFKAF